MTPEFFFQVNICNKSAKTISHFDSLPVIGETKARTLTGIPLPIIHLLVHEKNKNVNLNVIMTFLRTHILLTTLRNVCIDLCLSAKCPWEKNPLVGVLLGSIRSFFKASQQPRRVLYISRF